MKLTAPIVQKKEDQKIGYGPVLVPGEEDLDGDTVTKEKIEEVAYDWLENYRIVDADHSVQKVAVPVESHILREAREVEDLEGNSFTVPAGTWMIGARVKSDKQWQRIKNKELTGFSIMAVRADEDKAMKSKYMQSLKATLEELGEDFVIPAVSLVGDPAVPKAKIVSIKSAAAGNEEEKDEKSLCEQLKQEDMPEEALEALCESLGEEDGFFSRCMEHEVAQGMEEPEAFCAWLHYYCHDKWPAEEKSSGKNSLKLTDKVKNKLAGIIPLFSQKEGRTISQANLNRLERVIECLQDAEESLNDLIGLAYQERETETVEDELDHFTFREVSKEMDEEEMEELLGNIETATESISKTYQKAIKELNNDEEEGQEEGSEGSEGSEEVTKKDILGLIEENWDIDSESAGKILKEAAEILSEEEEELDIAEIKEQAEEKAQKIEDLQDKLDTLKEEKEDLKDQLNKSKSLKGQDGDDYNDDGGGEEEPRRDHFGRRIQ